MKQIAVEMLLTVSLLLVGIVVFGGILMAIL